MLFRTSLICLALSLVCWSAQASAQEDTPDKEIEPPRASGIDIEVRGGAARVLTPLAVPATKVAGGAASSLAEQVTEVLRRDLELAGFFRVIPDDGLFFDPAKEGLETKEINFANWANVGAQGLIKSAVALEGGKATLDMRLYVVTKGERAQLKYTPSAVSAAGVTSEAHKFANAVVEYYTGQPGMFGSRIAYVRRNKQGAKQIWVTDMSGLQTGGVTKNKAINLIPSWGGGAIYYTSYQDQNPDLWVWRGGSHKKLSSRPGQNSGGVPVWRQAGPDAV